ncbi:hypothetical protein QUB47_26540 [Microcoleus sp. AT9_B5]
MTEEKNQQPQVSLETSFEQPQLEKPVEQAAETAEQLWRNVNYETLSQTVANNAEDRLKALGRLMMVSLTWSLAGLSKRE